MFVSKTDTSSITQPKKQYLYIIQEARYANIYRGWPEELGGQWYPTERGRFSKELLQQLQDDCPDCPMWPDAEDASNAAAADTVPTEKFALMPHWLGISYWLRGRQGYWDAPLTGGFAQQVGMNICLACIWNLLHGIRQSPVLNNFANPKMLVASGMGICTNIICLLTPLLACAGHQSHPLQSNRRYLYSQVRNTHVSGPL